LFTHRPWRLHLLQRLQPHLLLPVHLLPRHRQHRLLRLPHLRLLHLPRSPDSRAAFFKSRPRKGSAFLM
jgi:hypothetical protein